MKIIESNFSNELHIQFVSSDEIKGKMISKHLEDNPKKSFQKVFDSITESNEFKNAIKDQLNLAVKSIDKTKLNIICFDKNYIPELLPNAKKEFETMVKKETLRAQLIVFQPNISESSKIKIAKDLEFPFSFDYLIQSYLRLKNRTNHGTLDSKKNPKFYLVYLLFLFRYKNFETKKISKFCNGTIKLSFTDERSSTDNDKRFEELSSLLEKVYRQSIGKDGK